MQTYGATLAVTDRVSNVIGGMIGTMNQMLSMLDHIQSATDSAFDPAAMDSMRGSLAQTESLYNQMQADIRASAEEQERFNDKLNRGNSIAESLGGNVGGMMKAFLGVQTVRKAAEFVSSAADAYSAQLNAERQLQGVLKNTAADPAAAYQSIYGNEAMIAAGGEFATYFKDSNATLMMMDTLANYAMGMTGGGAVSQEQMVNYATGLGKIMTGSYEAMTKKGFEFSDAQKAIIEGTATQAQITETLGAEYTAMSQDMQAAAAISQVINESWNGLYETMSDTPEGGILSLQNKLGDLKEYIGGQIMPYVGAIVEVINANFGGLQNLADHFIGIVQNILSVANLLIRAGAFVAQNWAAIRPLILGVAAAVGVLLLAKAAYNGVQAIENGLLAIGAFAFQVHAAAIAQSNGMTFAAMVAQYGFNAALLACPITWIILGVIALIAVIAAVMGAINKVNGVTHSVLGSIVGAVFWVVGLIWNIIVGVINGIVQYLWTRFVEPFIGVIEWILNVCNGGFNSFGDAVKNLLGNIISWFLSLGKVVTKIIDAIFGTNWTAGLANLQNTVLAWGKNENAITLSREAPTVLHRLDLSDTFDKGASLGDKWTQAIKDEFSLETAAYDLSGIESDAADIAAATNDIAGTISGVGEDELKYLRMIAERDAVNKFTTAEIHLDVTSSATINSDLDVDGFFDRFTDEIEEVLVTAAEGLEA